LSAAKDKINKVLLLVAKEKGRERVWSEACGENEQSGNPTRSLKSRGGEESSFGNIQIII
jgi:hypothetical protein